MRKTTTVLIDDLYKNPGTSLLTFCFEPHLSDRSDIRLKNCRSQHATVEGKDLYIFDDYFEAAEADDLRRFSKTTTFSRHSYGSPEAIQTGEKPARSMNGKERWQFFSNPPSAIKELYNVLSLLSHQLDAEITTLPWELCDASLHGSPAVIANMIEEATTESMDLGKHQDCSPEKKLSFGIPILYENESKYHDSQFMNGATGKPWLVSLMLYSTDVEFLPEYRMGTAFYEKNGQIAHRVGCTDMRWVLFESDILHSIEASNIPPHIKTWRISYVFKLIMNPRSPHQNIKAELYKQLTSGVEDIKMLFNIQL
jgi:hypothetical protein